MKKLLLGLIFALVGGLVFAETDYPTKRNVELLQVDMEAAQADIATAQTDIDALEAATTISLASNKVFIGSSAGKAAAQTITGDITIATNGAVAIVSGVIVDADVATNAAINSTKLEASAQASLAKAASLPATSNLYFAVVAGTQLVAVAGTVTNVLDSDLTTP